MRISTALRSLLICSILWLCAASAAQEAEDSPAVMDDGATTRPIVYRLEIREAMMGEDMPFFLHRATEAAKAVGAQLIIIDIETPGGSLQVHMEMRDMLIGVDIPMISYINDSAISAGALIAVVADKIVMSPTSSIGGSQIITGTGQSLDEITEQKINSILKAELRATAKHKGHPIEVCEAFVDRNIEIPGLTPKGEVLTLDYEEATTTHTYVDSKTSETVSIPPLAAYVANDIDEILGREGLEGAEVRSYELSWSEKLAKFLLSIKPLLLLIALAAVYLEIKTPGVGVFLGMALVAFALFFFATHIADLSGVIEIVLVAIGLILLAAEIFVIPGFGVAGASGIICIVAGLLLALIKIPPADIPAMNSLVPQLNDALWTLAIALVGMIGVIIAGAYFLPRTSVFRFIELNPEDAAKDFAESAKSAHRYSGNKESDVDLTGQAGTALTDLRPAGAASIGNRRVDVVTWGDYLPAGSEIKIIRHEGNAYVVEAIEVHPEDKKNYTDTKKDTDDPFETT